MGYIAIPGQPVVDAFQAKLEQVSEFKHDREELSMRGIGGKAKLEGAIELAYLLRRAARLELMQILCLLAGRSGGRAGGFESGGGEAHVLGRCGKNVKRIQNRPLAHEPEIEIDALDF